MQIQIYLTGINNTVAPTLSSEHFNILCGIVQKRKVVLLDNVPDNRHQPHLLFLNPYEGRPANLCKYVDGLVVHPMPVLHPSKVHEDHDVH